MNRINGQYFIKTAMVCLLFLSGVTTALSKPTADTANSTKPFVLGQVDQIYSQQLSENRVLNIYLPADYNANKTTRYPVVYLLDGSADEDFIHVVGLYQFNSFPWVGRAPKSIIVGIANVDRKRDFTFPTTIKKDLKAYPSCGHSDKFIAFLETELQAYIQTKFRTTNAKTLIGESLGGLLAAQILLEKPELFNNYVIVSPSLWWNNGSLLEQSFDRPCKQASQKISVYIGVGKEGLAPTKIPRLMEVDANTLQEKLDACESKNLRVQFKYMPDENHATIMHQAMMNAFYFLYPVEKAN